MATSTETELRIIQVTNLLLDVINPRHSPQNSQREALRSVLENQQRKGSNLVVNLASDIIERGLSQADLFMVMPTADEKRHFIALDGNRRLTALKLLAEPELAAHWLPSRDYNKLKKLADKFAVAPITHVKAIVYGSREEAAPWIERRHSTEMEGKSQVSWGTLDKERFAAWRGASSPVLRLLEFVRTHGSLTPEQDASLERVPPTTFMRLMDDPYVREKIGLRLENKQLYSDLADEEVVKPLKKIIFDLADGVKTVADLERKAERKAYVDGLAAQYMPDATSARTADHPLGTATTPATGSPNNTDTAATPTAIPARRRPLRSRQARTAIVPRECILEINQDRVNDIYLEMRRLSADEFPNSAAVMLRVFLELSVDDYIIQHNIIENERERRDTSLSNKITKTADYMLANSIMTEMQLTPVRSAAADQRMLATSIKSLNQYVHNQYTLPIPSELRTAWDNLQPFFLKIWPE